MLVGDLANVSGVAKPTFVRVHVWWDVPRCGRCNVQRRADEERICIPDVPKNDETKVICSFCAPHIAGDKASRLCRWSRAHGPMRLVLTGQTLMRCISEYLLSYSTDAGRLERIKANLLFILMCRKPRAYRWWINRPLGSVPYTPLPRNAVYALIAKKIAPFLGRDVMRAPTCSAPTIAMPAMCRGSRSFPS